MFRRRPQLPVTPEQQEWIEESFRLLIEMFGRDWVREAPLVLPNENFFPRKWEPTEDWARYAFDRVCDLMRVSRERVQLEFMQDPWEELVQAGVPLGTRSLSAGLHYEIEVEGGPSNAQIAIKESLIKRPEVMVATMAHELAHVLLLGDKKITRDMERMEPFTDLMTVFSGFGILNANAAHVHRRGSLGYLSQREYGYSLAVFAWLRGETRPSWAGELTTNVREFMRTTLASFEASGRSG